MKKAGIYILKVLIMLAVFVPAAALLCYLWVIIAFSGQPDTVRTILYFASAGTIGTAYITFAAWLSRQWNGGDKQHKVMSPILLILPITAIALVFSFRGEIEYRIEVYRARKAVAEADDIIRYENNSDFYSNMMGTELFQSSAAINYGKMQVAFIYDMDFARTKFVKLEKTGALPRDCIQFKTELKSPGKYFYTYYPEDDTNYLIYRRTCGAGIEMEDGACFYAGFPKEMLDFDGISARIFAAISKADIIIPYGSKALSAVCMGLETDSVLIDLDGMTLSVVYSYTAESFPQTQGLVNYSIQADIPLCAVSEDVHPVKQREIGYEGYTLYGYRNSEGDQWDQDRSDGFILITPEGKMYEAAEWGYYNFLQIER